MALLSGTSNAVLLAVINAAVGSISYQQMNFRFLLMYLIAFALFVISQRYILRESTIIIEGTIGQLRMRLSDRIRKVDLLSLENIGNTRIYNRLTQETIVISTSGPMLIFSLQSAIMLFFLSLYILTLSKLAFMLIIAALSSGILYYLHNHKVLQRKIQKSNETEMAFFESLTDILDGIKELKLNRKRNDGVYANLKDITTSLRDVKTDTQIQYFYNSIFANSFYYMLIGMLVFVLPRLNQTYTDVLTQLIAAVLFMIGPVGIIVTALQTFVQVDFAVANIYKLEEQLGKLLETFEKVRDRVAVKPARKFSKITLENLQFSYKDEEGNGGFSIGPFDFEINAGEILFIVGGNGSGKTTLLKLLTMLYYPDNGSIRLDSKEINKTDAANYREMFSAIFSDFHLFSRLYGLEDAKKKDVDKYLESMELEHKTEYLDNQFSTLELSTGQRKRLAMVVSRLENKPIVVFDEWAADQDPEFKDYFYGSLLQELKAEGKTVIATSHDDRYFDRADRVIKLDWGKIANITGNKKKEEQK
jgi:putative ATP-binding cassette transporter